MMNLLFKHGSAVLSCSSCAHTWQVDTALPFVEQLRTRLVDHRCDSSGVTSLQDWQARPAAAGRRRKLASRQQLVSQESQQSPV
jgi:hypothetical protein